MIRFIIQAVLLMAVVLSLTVAHAIQSWEEPCLRMASPSVPYPCGKDK